MISNSLKTCWTFIVTVDTHFIFERIRMVSLAGYGLCMNVNTQFRPSLDFFRDFFLGFFRDFWSKLFKKTPILSNFGLKYFLDVCVLIRDIGLGIWD